jgi:hypothetical protein
MEIHISPWQPATLWDPDDFSAFKVVASGFVSTSALRDALAAVGVPDDDGKHVFIEPAWLVASAQSVSDPAAWHVGLQSMASFAAKNGWVDGESRIRAHVEELSD